MDIFTQILPKTKVKIASNLASKIDEIVASLDFNGSKLGKSEICFISDEKIWQNCQKFFAGKISKISHETLILKDAKADEKNLKKIENFILAKKYKLIIALGSGTINDLCKFASAKNNINYIIFASAASMNGYLSQNASLLIKGHKKTLKATLPKAVFCDLEILKSAPKKLIQAGIGDSVCFYSCWFDWLLSHLILGTNFDEKSFKILQEKIDFLFKNYHKFKIDDEKFLQLLIEILLLSGAAMTIAGGSYPASQSEHLIAHAFEMKYPKKAQKILHGSQIAITIFSSIKLQKALILKDSLAINPEKFPYQKIAKLFGEKIAKECKKEYEAKLNYNFKEINKALKLDWKRHRKILQKIFCDEKIIKNIFKHFKIKISEKSLGLSSQQYQELTTNAKFIRNRFTCLDV